MRTLKQARERLQVSQTEVADKTNLTSSELSRYESGQLVPDLEHMVILERNFSQKLDWSKNEKIDEESKETIIQCFNELVKSYPLLSVLRFIDQGIKLGIKMDDPSKYVEHFTNVARGTDEPMLPIS
jgi:transcriptional regulator with XRE-family HTH domain